MLKERITLRLKEMTPGQAAVARFLLDHRKEAAFLTASQIGERVGVSETTVIRLSRLLGYSGYLQLRSEMTSSLIDHLSTLERIKDYGTSPENDIYERAIRKDMETLSAALSSIPSPELDALGQAITEAGAVYLAGYRSSFSLACYLSFYLSRILPNVHTIGADMPYEMLANAPADSLVLGISFPRYSRWTVDVLEMAEKLGLTTASVTNNLTSPLAAKSKYVVTAPYKPVSFIDSFAAPMSLLNCLILSVARSLGAGVTEKLEMLERHWRQEGIYTPDRTKPLP